MKITKNRAKGVFRGRRRGVPWTLPLAAAVAAACSAAPDDAAEGGVTGTDGDAQNTPAEDGLAEAYSKFVENFALFNLDADFRMGVGFHPGLSTERIEDSEGTPMAGQVILGMNTGRLTATLSNAPESGEFDLWFVKNEPGGTVMPEASDTALKVGRFEGSGSKRDLEIELGTDIAFDLDMVVVTRAGKKPAKSRLVVGSRTLFEKRLFRLRRGESLDPVTGALANDVETTDPLVARGAEIFFNETFGGNGRTCGTCHRAENNLTIDPAFIATLPQSDPLFVAENNPELAQLENPQLLRERGLILENLDGFDDPTNQFVMRSVQHTLSIGLTNGISEGFFASPDHRLGWSGDGGPGRSTLNEFSFGAVVQHFTKTLARRPGIDFRIPTQEELDALEAFQLFTGRQGNLDFSRRFPTDPQAARGQGAFFGSGCTFCHDDISEGFTGAFNGNFDTNVRALTPDLPFDDGFSALGEGSFNVQPVAEAADSPPFFHNNAVSTIEDAVSFYFSETFQASPFGFVIGSAPLSEQREIAAFLRVVNSFVNIEQVRKRLRYVKDVRSAGNTDLLAIALADTRDARVVLAQRELSPEVRALINKAETVIKNAKAAKDRDRPAAMKKALKHLDEASAALFTTTPPSGGFGGGGGFGGEPTTAGVAGFGGAFAGNGGGGSDQGGSSGAASSPGGEGGDPAQGTGGVGGSF